MFRILIEEKCLSAFVENAYQEAITNPESYRCYNLRYSYLLLAFAWSDSKEGKTFWKDIYDQCKEDFSELPRKEFAKLLAKPERTY